jgi:hypothetical protein
VATGVDDCTSPAWSTDGKWLYFGSGQIFKVPVAGGRSTQITRGGGDVPSVSSDGNSVYYERDSEIWSASAEGGDERRVAGVPPFAPGFGAAWTVGASGIYFMDLGSSRPGISFCSFSDARVVRLLDLPGRPTAWATMALSPDGGRLLYSQDGVSTSDIMLVDGFR